MTNSISQIEPKKVSPFGALTVKEPKDYLYSSQQVSMPEEKDEFVSAVLDPKIIINPEEARKTKNLTIIGLSIANVVVLTALGFFLFNKGLPKGIKSYFKNIKKNLEQKISSSKFKNNGNLSTLEKVDVYTMKKVDNITSRLESVNNFTTLKDFSFKKIMYALPFGSRIHNGITRVFEALGRQTVDKSYRKTAKKISDLKDLSDKYLKDKFTDDLLYLDGNLQHKAQVCEQIKSLNNELLRNYDKYFGNAALQERYHSFQDKFNNVLTNYINLKVFMGKKLVSDFIAETAVAGDKKSIKDAVKAYRNKLSYSKTDMVSKIENHIVQLTSELKYENADIIKHLKLILEDVKRYSKKPDDKLHDRILHKFDNLMEQVSDNALELELNSKIDTADFILELTKLRNHFSSFQQGKVQKILKLYEYILPSREYVKVEKQYKSTIAALDKSIKLETEDFLSKLRDLTVGSAPTDILTVLGSLGILGYQLGKSGDNDERVSITLRYGLPAMIGIGTMLYGNTRLFAGSKSLILATLTSLLGNKIGTQADEQLKRRRIAQNSVNVTPES